MKKRIVSIFLVLMLAVSLLSVSAMAVEGEELTTFVDDSTVDEAPTISKAVVTIDPSMNQSQIDAAVSYSSDVISIESGNYGENNKYKYIRIQNDAKIELNGVYEHLHIIVENNAQVSITTTGQTTLVGQSTEEIDSNDEGYFYGDYYTGILVKSGKVTFDSDLTISDYNHAIKLGVQTVNADSDIHITNGAQLVITNSHATTTPSSSDKDYWGGGMEEGDGVTKSQGHGASGSGIFVTGSGYSEIKVDNGAILDINNSGSANLYHTHGHLDILVDNATAHFDGSSGYCGIYSCDNPSISSLNIKLDNGSNMTCNNNRNNGITGQSGNWTLEISKSSDFSSDNNRAIGVNNMCVIISDSDMSVSNNKSHGASNVALDATDSKCDFSGNAYIGLNITKYNSEKTDTNIVGSTITANDNGGPGIRFYIGNGSTQITNSVVEANGNGCGESVYGYDVKPGDSGYWAGIVVKGTAYVDNSTIKSDSAGGFSHYNDSSAPATLHISGTDVIAFEGIDDKSDVDIFDDWNSQGNTGRTYVTGGSLQAEYQKISKGFDKTLNQLIPEVDGSTDKTKVQYSAPVNSSNTVLTRFDLHQAANKIVDENQNTFTVYDPNSDTTYEYTFRYNTDEEDLTGEGGNAYIWTPVTVIHYDATEGEIDLTGSTAVSGDVALTNTRGDNSSIANTVVGGNYIDATDYTICGNSLALSEGVVPVASRTGYAFSGWYYAVGEDVATAAGYAANGNYEALYNLLLTGGKKFEDTTLTSDDAVNVEEITVYAVWTNFITITPADITIYMGGDEGYEGVVGGTQMGSDSLPPPLFYVQLPEGLEDVDVAANMKMYGDEGREWKFIHVGEDEDSVPLYYIESTGYDTQDPVRVTYTDTDGGDPIISDAFDPATVGEVFNDYTIAVYRGDSGEVSVDIDGVRYAVETGTGTLRVRAVEDTEGGENPVVGVTAEVSEPVGAGKAAITAPEDTEYTLNNTTVKVEAAGVGLLFDGIIDTDVNRTNALVERAEDALGGSFGNRYQAQYLDLVDAENGNAWVKADNKVTVYWGYPEGTGRYTDFTLLHFEDLHRDGALSGFDVADVDDCTVTEVEIRRTANGIAFDIESGGFSPFLLVWNVKTDPGPGPGPGPDTEPDEPGWPVVRPDEPEGLNTEDHVAYIIGYPDGGVHPTGDITRAEVATIFFRLLTDEARDEYWSSESGFTDVESGDWFNNAVSTLAKMGILGGYEDGSFRPNAPITRAEFTKIAVSFFEKASEIAYDGRFTDIAGSEWYADAVAGAAYYGLIDGYGDGTFRPGANITRAEACTIVNRVLGRAPHEDHLLPAGEMLTWPDNKPGAWYYADMQEATNSHDYEWAGEIENWLEKLPERDWDALEREWSDAHSAPGGEVMG